MAFPFEKAYIAPGMIKVFNKDTNELLGRISEEELEFLRATLEKESLDDHDYFMTRETIEGFRGLGAPEHLTELLINSLRNDKEIEIRWERDLPAKTEP